MKEGGIFESLCSPFDGVGWVPQRDFSGFEPDGWDTSHKGTEFARAHLERNWVWFSYK